MSSDDVNKKPEKPEVKKLEDMLPFNPFEVLGLRPKPLEEKYKKYVGLNMRMIASTIDTLIAAIVLSPFIDFLMSGFFHSRAITMEEVADAQSHTGTEVHDLLMLLSDSGKLSELLIGSALEMLALIIASAICWKLWSATPGKMLLRMKIVDADSEQPMTDKQILLRSLGYIPACVVFFLGIFWISFNKKHQGWHDMIANTAVIKVPRKKDVPAPAENAG